jgi:hypothetical protein
MQGHKGSGARTKASKPDTGNEKTEKPAKQRAQPDQSGTGPPAATPGAKQVRAKPARRVKKQCKQQVVNQMDQIITGLIRKAKEGSVSHAKFLLDFADANAVGAQPATGKKGRRSAQEKASAEGDSLAELLLHRLDGESEGPSAALPAAKAPTRSRRIEIPRQANLSGKESSA